MNTRTPKNFRLSADTLRQLDWLAARLGGISATDVITIAVADLHERKRREWKAKISRTEDGGGWRLAVGGTPIAYCGEKTLQALPAGRRRALLEGNQEDAALAELILAAARADEQIVLSPQTIAGLYGPAISERKKKARG
jgi:hypothetical protein